MERGRREVGGHVSDAGRVMSFLKKTLWVSVFILQRERHATRVSGGISAFESLGL